MKLLRTSLPIAVITLLWIAKLLFTGMLGPAWYAEDELDHFGYIDTLWQTKLNPQWEDFYARSKLIDEYYDITRVDTPPDPSQTHRINTSYQPPGYYAIIATILYPFRFSQLIDLLYMSRMVSLLLAAPIPIIIYAGFKKLHFNNQWSLFASSVVVLHPLVSFTLSHVNSDTLIILSGTVTSAILLSSWHRGWDYKSSIILTTALTAGLVAKQSMLIYAAITLMIIGFQWFYRGPKKHLMFLLILTLIATAIGLWQFYIKNQNVIYVDTSLQLTPESPFLYPITQFKRLNQTGIDTFWQQQLAFIPYQAPPWFNNIGRLFLATGVLGSIVYLGERLRHRRFTATEFALLTSIITVLSWLAMIVFLDYQHWQNTQQFWFKGRYLFPAIFPILYIVLFGHKYLLQHIPAKTNLYMTFILTTFSLFSIHSIWWLITNLYK